MQAALSFVSKHAALVYNACAWGAWHGACHGPAAVPPGPNVQCSTSRRCDDVSVHGLRTRAKDGLQPWHRTSKHRPKRSLELPAGKFSALHVGRTSSTMHIHVQAGSPRKLVLRTHGLTTMSDHSTLDHSAMGRPNMPGGNHDTLTQQRCMGGWKERLHATPS